MKKLSLQAFEKSNLSFLINVFLNTKGSRADFKFQILGDLSQIKFLENHTDSLFTKNLWQSTCAEIFIKNENESRYLEWNFGFNSHWWSAEFTRYRKIDKEREDLLPLSQEKYISKKNDEMLFMISLDLSEIEAKPDAQFHPSLVLQTKKGPKIHWALQHPFEQPDFHRAENFKEYLFF